MDYKLRYKAETRIFNRTKVAAGDSLYDALVNHMDNSEQQDLITVEIVIGSD